MALGGARSASLRGTAVGQSLVEFALVIPIFLLILFAIFDFGMMAFSRITLNNATREGARAGAILGGNTLAIDENLGASGGPIRANATGLVQGDLTIVATCIPATGLSACDFDADAGDGQRQAQTGDQVHVTSTYVYHSFFGRFIGQTITLQSSARMVIE
jgi:Flp pilus assembly protein TadG